MAQGRNFLNLKLSQSHTFVMLLLYSKHPFLRFFTQTAGEELHKLVNASPFALLQKI